METLPAMFARDLKVRLGRTEILKGIDLEVHQGDIYGLLGRNGAGKTTTMRCLLGLLRPGGGRAEVFGIPSTQLFKVPEPLGVALDPPGLDESLTVRANLEMARLRAGLRSGRTVDQALELVGLQYRQHNRGNRLSHGQGRRAAVARALLGSPRLLVLDEPLSGLDPEGVEEMLSLFERLSVEEGVTTVFSSHHLREVQEVCNRVGLIDDGQVILEGETQALLAAAGDGLQVLCASQKRDKAKKILEEYTGVSQVHLNAQGVLRARVEAKTNLQPLLARLVQAEVGLEEFARDRASLADVYRRAVS
ncbi:MAG: ABC transporter ATP-binding protein [Planctomycetota bacterium]|nr:MAG: ABC transporter ATP-binding protein [Planctomycetota bacterium]